jgi:predicted AAA+ superfamily ATPase
MERFNPWWKNEEDQSLEEWNASSVKWIPQDVISSVSLQPFSLNFLSGPRQVGKTTAIKLLIKELLKSREPKSVLYYSCDELSDHSELGEVLDTYLRSSEARGLAKGGGRIIFLDEVTFVGDWWRALKSRIDDGSLKGDVVTVTGSGSLDLLTQKERFPGRRGNGVDIVMRPRSFGQYVAAIGGPSVATFESLSMAEDAIAANGLHSYSVSRYFDEYLQTGGFPRPIIEMKERGRVGDSAVKTLLDWLRTDWGKAGRSDRYMKEVLAYILRAIGTPVSWLSMARETSIGSPHTTQAYVETLERLLAVLVLELITPQGRVLHRKNRKVHFPDPLLYRAFGDFTAVEVDEAAIVEGTVASHLSRRWETHYWRDGTEVDAVALERGKQFGVETKWGFKKGSRPRHLSSSFISLDRKRVPLFLASMG